MRGTKAFFAVVVLTAIAGLASTANAQLQFVGVGSSAMFNTVSAAAFTDLCSSRSGSACHHWSAKGKNSADNQNWAQGVDSRNSSIPVEAGNFFVAWDSNSSPIKIWSYLSVDTIVGQRLFFAVPRATQQIDSGALSAAGQNLVPAAILLNRQTSTDQPDETTGIPSAVLSAVQTSFTAAISDVRPEDPSPARIHSLAQLPGSTRPSRWVQSPLSSSTTRATPTAWACLALMAMSPSRT